MAAQNQSPNMDQFEAYFRRADSDQDGRISGTEAVTFFQGSNLPKPVLAQIWTYVDQSRTGFLSRQEFYNYLKLVTVAQKRDLTPEIVKAALFTPASAKIPPPQINLAAIPGPRPMSKVGAAVPPIAGAAPTTQPSFGIRGQGLPVQQNQYMRPPRPPIPSPGFQPQAGVSGPGMPGAGTMAAFRPPSSSDRLAGRNGDSQAGATSPAPNMGFGSGSQDGFGRAPPHQIQQEITPSGLPGASKSNDATLRGNQPDTKDSKAVPVTGNGFASDSLFGDVYSVAPVQPKQNSSLNISSASSLPDSLATAPASTGPQPPVKASSVGPQVAPFQQPVHQHPQAQLTVRPNQQVPVQSSAANPNAAGSLSSQSQLPWPRMTQSDYQKYSKVFMAVDTDRDGKITGQEARNLFLSWKLPREVLKQVWDLSDQDNDSMLSLKEFCVALYLMERHREGRTLPSVLPTNLIFDVSQLPASGQPIPSHGAVPWRHTPAPQQTQGPRGAPQVASSSLGKPPRPVSISQSDEAVQPIQQRPKVPELEKHLVDQLSQEEQDALNSKFQEATDAEKKVMELEKEILDAKEKIQFYHAKMQEVILYKSRCDNRLNEITARTSADKREVELLAKKYEEKYKQTGDVASKLTIEEATFRDLQEKKMELYKAIVKMDQDSKADGIQDCANHIQVDLEELVKALNERCKTYGLRAKPTTLLELPFGWQPGMQEGAADWDEEWDKFEDEGFTFVKELTLDVQNVIAPPKPKSSLVREKESTLDDHATGKSSADADTDAKIEKLPSHAQTREVSEVESANGDEQRARSPTESPTKSNAAVSPSKEFQESLYRKEVSFDGSPRAAQSEHWGTESAFSRDKGSDESGWGTFDTSYDTDAAWDFNSVAKIADHENHKESSLFGADDWGLSPIKTGSTQSSNALPRQSPFFDSVPSTPSNNAGFSYSDNTFPKQSPFFDSVPSTPNYNSGFTQTDNLFSRQSSFFDSSVPSTPAYNSGSPNADTMFQKKSPFGFADSVPSTPMYNSTNSPRGFSERSEDYTNNFSRFDSFDMRDSGPFGTRESFSRFDSMRSTRDSDFDTGSFQQRDSLARFDSFRSTADSDYNFGQAPPRESLTRFDSISSTRDTDYGHRFPSFDDADPFGSNEPFKTSSENQTPRRDSDSWKAF